MYSNTLLFLRACGQLASFFWVSLEHWTNVHKSFKMHLTLLRYSCICSFCSFLLWASLALPSPLALPKSLDTFLHPGFLHLLFVDSFHILSLFLLPVILWESPLSLVSASVGGDCFVRSLVGNNKVQSKESGLQSNSVTQVAVHEGYYVQIISNVVLSNL